MRESITVSIGAADYHDTRVSEYTFPSEAALIRAVLSTPKPLSSETLRWMFVRFRGQRRSQENAGANVALVGDWDRDRMTLEELADRIPWWGLYHTTGSHTPEAPRTRAIWLLKYPVVRLEYPAVWGQVRQVLPGDPDKACSNWAQPWRCPADNGHYRAIFRDGPKLDPGPLLLAHAEEQRQREAELANVGDLEGDMVARAIAYLGKMDPAISGAGGHIATFRAARVLVHGCELDDRTAYRLLDEHYNRVKCFPQWKPRELWHKIISARSNARYTNRLENRPREGA